MPVSQASFLRAAALTALALAALALVGCTEAMRQIRGASAAYDGAWVGHFEVVTRTRSCEITRGGLRATIEGGSIDGMVRQRTGSNPLTGFILEDGDLADGRMFARYEVDSAELEGAFDGDEAEGTWLSEECTGVWRMRKIR
ncbi:MAG: hypothetical protein RIB45_14720 [Marivibrio sp.]|uniref:hypothetical protein n=1 Tax=Marivibrio sp. TaxID=2039719 RepID=UPI0032EDD4C2